ncbi:MAG TPA: hypothetical protein VIC55_12150, partial [Gemmatimonadaceae bacterium]
MPPSSHNAAIPSPPPPGTPRRKGPNPARRWWPIGAALGASILIAIVAYRLLLPGSAPIPEVSYSEVAQSLANHQVSDLLVDNGGLKLVATLRSPRTVGGRSVSMVRTNLPLRAITLADLQQWGAGGTRVRVSESGGTPGAELVIQLL